MLSLKKKTLMWGLTAALVGTVGLVAFADNKANIFQATDSSYTLKLSKDNGIISPSGSGYQSGTTTATTTLGNSITSDIELPTLIDVTELGERTEPNALRWDKIYPAEYNELLDNSQFVSVLTHNYQERVKDDPVFNVIKS